MVYPDARWSLEPLAAAFHDPARLAELARNTGLVTAGTVAVALGLGLPAGLLCGRTDLPFRRLIVGLALLALCIPSYAVTTGWLALFTQRSWLASWLGAAWIQGVALAPLALLITAACAAQANPDLEAQAALDGGAWALLRHVALPQTFWAAGLAALGVGLLSLWDIGVTDILLVRTFGEEIFTQFQLGAGPARAAAVSLPALALGLLLAALLWGSLRHYQDAEPASGPALTRPIIRLGRLRWPLALLIAASAAAAFGVPFAALARAVGSFGNFAAAFQACGPELVNTLRVTPLAALLALPLAWAAALQLRRGGWPACVTRAALMLLLAAPAPLVGMGLIALLNRHGWPGRLYDSEWVLALAYVIRAWPFGVLVLLPALRLVPRALEDAAAVDGAGLWARLRAVQAPFCCRALAVAWLLMLVLALAETGASLILMPPGQATLSIRFLTLVHYGVYADAASVCLILTALAGAAAGAMAFLLRRSLRQEAV